VRVEVLLDLDNEMLLGISVDDQRVMDAGEVAGRKLRIDDDAGYAYDCSASLHTRTPR
jgi:hypothetical protein